MIKKWDRYFLNDNYVYDEILDILWLREPKEHTQHGYRVPTYKELYSLILPKQIIKDLFPLLNGIIISSTNYEHNKLFKKGVCFDYTKQDVFYGLTAPVIINISSSDEYNRNKNFMLIKRKGLLSTNYEINNLIYA